MIEISLEKILETIPRFAKIRIEDMRKAPHNMWDANDVCFSHTFVKIKDSSYEESYWTSSFDEYCYVYGEFCSCDDCKKRCNPHIVDCDYISSFITDIEDKYNINTFLDKGNNTLHIWYR